MWSNARTSWIKNTERMTENNLYTLYRICYFKNKGILKSTRAQESESEKASETF